MSRGFKQGIASATIFAGLVGFLVWVDPRVRERVTQLVAQNSADTLGHKFTDLGTTLLSAARHQSIENAPLVIFAVVGAILFLFMLKT
jgi:hypothetical protein